MITNKQAWAYFESLGWTRSKDEVGDTQHMKMLTDRRVSVLFDFRRLPENYTLRSSFSVSTSEYLETSSYVAGRKEMGYHILARGKTLRQESFDFCDMENYSDFLISWALETNLEEELKKLRELPTSAPGNAPLRHLSALAVAGDVKTLTMYQAALAKGDRLGFVPYIKEDYIDRALQKAKDRSAL